MLILGDWAPGNLIDFVEFKIVSDLFVINLEGVIHSQPFMEQDQLEIYQAAKVGPLLRNKVGLELSQP